MNCHFPLGGLDFQPVNTTLTFRPGVTTATRTVFLLDDQISEGLENFEVQVVLVDQELGDPGVVVSATVLVFDNESTLKGGGMASVGGVCVWRGRYVCGGGAVCVCVSLF